MSFPRFIDADPQRAPGDTFFASYAKLLCISVIFCASFMTSACNLSGLGSNASAAFPQLLTVTGILPRAVSGRPYNLTLSVTGGAGPYQFAQYSGSLPAGLTLSSSGTISGTLANAGTFRFGVAVTDSRNEHGYREFWVAVFPENSEIRVAVSPASSISLKSGEKQQFSASLTGTSNTAVTWSASVGKISSTGLYTAPTVNQQMSVTVTASSVADPGQASNASVLVAPSQGSSQIRVAVSPASSISLKSGEKQQFSANVSGTSNTAVTWSASAGKISSTGLYTAPTVNQQMSVTVTASSVADPSQVSNISVLVASSQGSGGPPPTGADNRYCGLGNVAKFGTTDGPAVLPVNCFYTALAATPSPGIVTHLASGSDLQSAINSANCGDTLMLQAGAVWTTGQILFPAKSCNDSNWITIRTDAALSELPAEGTRMTPCYAGVRSLPGRPTLNCSSTQNVLAKIAYSGLNAAGPFLFANGASHYRLIGLEVTKSDTRYVNVLAGAAPGATFDHIIFDRVWFHGYATDETTRGINVSGGSYVAVIDSYFSDFHCKSLGSCTDSQAISGGIGLRGGTTYKIVNNFLESSGENILFGGSEGNYTPADTEIRRNHFFKPTTWFINDPQYIGVAFVVKNHLEFKNAQRVLVEGNIFENSWGGFSQNGESFGLTPKNAGGYCSVCEVVDITYRFNTISHVGEGIQLANVLAGTYAAQDGQRYSIHDIVIDDINGHYYKGFGLLAEVDTEYDTGAVPLLQNVNLNHITAFPDMTMGNMLNIGSAVSRPMLNFLYTNNIVSAGKYPVTTTGGGTGNCALSGVPITVIQTCFSPYTFSNNVIIAAPAPDKWPSGQYFPTTHAAVNFVNFNGGSGGDYHLSPSSPYKGLASDGKDPGADISAIAQETAGVY